MRKNRQDHVRDILNSFDLKGEMFHDTPRRWIAFLEEFRQEFDYANILGSALTEITELDEVLDPSEHDIDDTYKRSMVIQSNIPYQAVCGHHLLPVLGRAHLGYVPNMHVIGLSKLARLVHAVTHESPSMQEFVGQRIIKLFEAYVSPIGVMCLIEAEHGCMSCRGVAELGVTTWTASLGGIFRDNKDARNEFYKIIGR